MRIAFYAPLKPLSHPNPSGDRTIGRELWQYFQEQGARCITLSEFRSTWFWLSFRGWWNWLRALVRALAFAVRERPDVIFTYHTYYKAPDAIGPVVAAVFGIPYVILEGSYAPQAGKSWKTWVGYRWTRWALKSADHVIANMSEDVPELERLLGQAKVSYIPPAVDSEFFSPPEDDESDRPVEILCVAMMRDWRKSEGVRLLLRAAAALQQRGVKSFRVTIAGDGKERAAIEQETAAQLTAASYRFLGAVPRQQLPDCYRAADIFAFPGIDEGFGLVYLEAQASGLPVVAMDNGGVPDAVDRDRSALLTPLGDEAAYAAALERLICDKSLRLQMQGAARKYVEKCHSRSGNYGRVYSILQQVSGGQRRLGFERTTDRKSVV